MSEYRHIMVRAGQPWSRLSCRLSESNRWPTHYEKPGTPPWARYQRR